ncbi:hypothetical protein BV22DRAFT_1134081 [Leucogyrophana mollusca]|uniref:Uncharacterized protein n=1 Tax=Leucogyrophana mollusca TaxID=85980 RepID=A0ACB8B130_9AGAM|nr:hypothetical protein BV22DRAFT_1134081 [Leucogyrophana mollusca]
MPPLKSFPPAADALQNYRPRCGRLPAPRTSLTPKRPSHHDILALLSRVKSGVVLNNDSDFFLFFPAIYALTSTPDALAIATRAVLEDSPQPPDSHPPCVFLELHTTPRRASHMSRHTCLVTALAEIENFTCTSPIISIDCDARGGESWDSTCVGIWIRVK